MPGAIDGLKILDFTTLLPGPYATMTLADMGADVLRVISGSRPDMAAFAPPFIPGMDISFATACLGRGKRCMQLNLKDPEAIRIVHSLICDYDILIEQFRPGVMEKLGLGYTALSQINPGLIYCSLTGYGQTGPYHARAGHDINYLARSGLMSYSGKKKDGPSLVGMQIADIAAGSSNAVIGILAAVISRNATQTGQHIDISMTDGVIAFNALVGNACLVDGNEPGREDYLLNGGCLYDFYRTSDDKYLSFGGLEPQFFSAFCEAIGRPDLVPGGVWPEALPKVKQQVRAIIRTKTRDEWMEIFDNIDACVEPVLCLSEALEDQHAQERGMIVEVDLPTGEKVRQLASPVRFSKTPQEYKKAGVVAGTHTREVMLELGYTDKEIDRFEKDGLFK
ncbi:MAG: CaiB/BaiF CoA-transferase family protein [Thermodesulfobacteriota bacterium]|nr:CaiB/BaiF CoA-transferase family protein [Thermodesulfobacteriota bacterium]